MSSVATSAISTDGSETTIGPKRLEDLETISKNYLLLNVPNNVPRLSDEAVTKFWREMLEKLPGQGQEGSCKAISVKSTTSQRSIMLRALRRRQEIIAIRNKKRLKEKQLQKK